MTLFLQVEPETNVDTRSVVVRTNRSKPWGWGDDDGSSIGCVVQRGIGAVVVAIAVLHSAFVALPVPLVVGLLFLVGVVMAIVVGLGSGTSTDSGDSNQKRSNAETLSKRHSQSFD